MQQPLEVDGDYFPYFNINKSVETVKKSMMQKKSLLTNSIIVILKIL